MAKNDTEIALIAQKYGLIDENTLRFIRVGYPLLSVRADIMTHHDKVGFSLIKKYIHRLVTGDQPNAEKPISYVKDRLEAAVLLGLDQELFDVASYCYDDLIFSGKIHDSPRGALAGAAPAGDPALSRVRTARKIETRLVVDPFSAEIYGSRVTELYARSLEEIKKAHKEDIYLPILPDFVSKPEELEALINQKNFSFRDCTEEYMTARLMEQNMPHGAIGVEIVQEEDKDAVEVFFLPYYLALKRTQEGEELFLFSQASTKPVDLFPIHDADHESFRRLLKSYFQSSHYGEVFYSFTDLVNFPLAGLEDALAPGVLRDEYGNYQTPVSDLQIAFLCMEKEADAEGYIRLLLDGVGVIPSREAGRLVHFLLTEEQKELCRTILSNPSDRFSAVLPILQKEAERDPDAAYHFANCLFMGRGIKEDPQKAYSIYESNAARGHDWSLFQQSVCLAFGEGVEKDIVRSVEVLKKILPKAPCYHLALHNLGVFYLQMAQDAEKERNARANEIKENSPEEESQFQAASQKKIQEFYEKSAEAFLLCGAKKYVIPLTSLALGNMYYHGHGVEQNMEKAFEFFSEAAKRGNLGAQLMLGVCYVQGAGTAKDYVRAKEVLRTVATRSISEESVFFLGSKPFIPYPNFCVRQAQFQMRKQLLQRYQARAKELLSKL